MIQRALVFFCLGILFACAVVSACTPKQGQDVKAAAPSIEKAACVVLVALEPSARSFCATADDLAPYVDDLVSQLEAARAVDPAPPLPVASSSQPLLAMSLAPPRRVRQPAKRHCAQWVAVQEGGAGGL